jgi:hypothetical protein
VTATRRTVSAIALAGLGLGGGYLLGALPAPSLPPAQVVHDVVERAPPGGDRGVSAAELRRVVREELAAAPGQRAVAPGVDLAPAAPPPGNPVALADGLRRVDQAIAQQRWTRDDAAALGRALDAMSVDQRAQVLRTLVPAINRGAIKLAYRGEPF